jgi:hypothetical protein
VVIDPAVVQRLREVVKALSAALGDAAQGAANIGSVAPGGGAQLRQTSAMSPQLAAAGGAAPQGSECCGGASSAGAPGAAPAGSPVVDAINGVVQARQQSTAASRASIGQAALLPGQAALAQVQSILVDSDEATTRRLQGLAAIVTGAGQLSAGESALAQQIVQQASAPGGVANEADVVRLASRIQERTGAIPAGVARASEVIGQIVAERQRTLRASASTPGVSDPAGLAAQLAAYNDLTSRIGKTMLAVQKLGQVVPADQQQAMLAAASAAQQPGADPQQLLATLQSIVVQNGGALPA